MEKNVFQKAKEYGLIDGYVPSISPLLIIKTLDYLASEADKDEDMKETSALFRDASAIVEICYSTFNEVIKDYESRQKDA